LGYSLRGFAVKVELLSSSDAHIRYVPAAMVDAHRPHRAHLPAAGDYKEAFRYLRPPLEKVGKSLLPVQKT
jgi:hypothetical protein